MLLKNNSKRSFVHSQLDKNYKLVLLMLEPGAVKEIPDEIAKSWLKSGEVEEYVDPAKAKAEQAKIAKENEELKKELEALKEEKREVKKVAKTTKKSKK